MVLLLIAACAITAHAQQTQQMIISDDSSVANEDGGRAFIIERNTHSLISLGPGRKGIGAPEQFSIFVGEGWASSPVRERETQLQNLLANVTDEADLNGLQERGIKNRFGPTSSVERPDVAARTFSDLDIQRLLASMLGSHTLPDPNAKSIFVVFLDTNCGSTLGALTGGKHYVAYHSAFRVSGANVRYVVVPYNSDATAANQIALLAFIAAAAKPAHP
jgi:hypothetical protein